MTDWVPNDNVRWPSGLRSPTTTPGGGTTTMPPTINLSKRKTIDALKKLLKKLKRGK